MDIKPFKAHNENHSSVLNVELVKETKCGKDSLNIKHDNVTELIESNSIDILKNKNDNSVIDVESTETNCGKDGIINIDQDNVAPELIESNSIDILNKNDSSVIDVESTETNCGKDGVINIDQDDVAPELIESNPPIALEDSDDCAIIESIPQNNNRHDLISFDNINKENKLLLELIEKCLDMENSKGMHRIVNRTLIPIYLDADQLYRKSEEFNRFLLKQIRKIDMVPEKKFTHIKEVCELLKANKRGMVKKKVSFVTLEVNNDKSRKKKCIVHPEQKKFKRKKVSLNTIPISDSDTDVEIINDNIDASVHIDSDSATNKDNTLNDNDGDVIAIDDENDNSNKENDLVNDSTTEHCILAKEIVHKLVEREPNKHLEITNDIVQNTSVDKINMELQKQAEKQIELKKEETIKYLEYQIATFTKLVRELEEREVLDDNFESPYVVSESYKLRIVKLYKQLCNVTGTEAVKRHEVRLKVAPGHHEGPIRCLEEFLNNNIDENGNTPFPDLMDVMQCVLKANVDYNLKWSRRQVYEEARELFTNYGRAMQKRRMHREWRHLLKYMKEEAQDPAEIDPVLEAKLAENDRLKKPEKDLLDSYSELEKTNHHDLNVTVENEDSAEDSDYQTPSTSASNIGSVPRNLSNKDGNVNTDNNVSNGNLNNNISLFVVGNVNEPNRQNIIPNTLNIEIPISNVANQQNMLIFCNPAQTITQNLVTGIVPNMPNAMLNVPVPMQNIVTNIVQPVPSIVVNCYNKADALINHQKDTDLPNQPKDLIANDPQKDGNSLSSENPNVGSFAPITHKRKNLFSIPTKHSKHTTDVENSEKVRTEANVALAKTISQKETEEISEKGIKEISDDDTKVKREAPDLPHLLEEFGEVTATVFDIEDPFVIVEVSDSSDSEDGY